MSTATQRRGISPHLMIAMMIIGLFGAGFLYRTVSQDRDNSNIVLMVVTANAKTKVIAKSVSNRLGKRDHGSGEYGPSGMIQVARNKHETVFNVPLEVLKGETLDITFNVTVLAPYPDGPHATATCALYSHWKPNKKPKWIGYSVALPGKPITVGHCNEVIVGT